MTTAQEAPARPAMDWEAFGRSLDGVPFSLDPPLVKRKSRDFYWYSPILNRTLDGKYADLLVMPRDEADVVTVARRCVAAGVPLTVRGAGTGNYGQAMPLEGGVVLETTGLAEIKWLRPGAVRCGAGLKMLDLDQAAKQIGWELRLHPSTKRTATIGGFIAGGSSGVGAIQYGLLRDPGNIAGLRVVTFEDEPRVLELRGPDIQKVNHAYGTNGIITEVEIPLAPAHAWREFVVTFADLDAALGFGQAVAEAEGVVKKELSVYAASVGPFFRPLKSALGEGRPFAIAMIAEESVEAFGHLVAAHDGSPTDRGPPDESPQATPLYEYAWNHTTMHALRHDRSITYLQTLFPPGRSLALVRHMVETFGDEVPLHVEFVRFAGSIACLGLQLLRYSSEARLAEIIAYHEAQGAPIFNPHTHVLEDGGMKVVDPVQLAFKREADPHGLLNPGKMRGWWENQAVAAREGALYR